MMAVPPESGRVTRARAFVRLVLFTVVCGVISSWPAHAADRNPIVKLQELILSEVKLERTTLKEGVEVVKKEWQARYPAEPFPVIILENGEGRGDSKLHATATWKNVSALAAVTYVAEAHSMSVRHGLDVIVLRPMVSADESAWNSVMLSVSARAMKSLGLSAEADGDEAANLQLRKRLEAFGVSFEPKFLVDWYGRSGRLFVINTPEQIARIKGILLLLDAGYSIQKVKRE